MVTRDLVSWFGNLLDLDSINIRDYALNGLQVGDVNGEIRKVCFSVDACLASFERAVAAEAQMLFVHHGLFWGQEMTITGNHYHHIKYLLDKGLSLYASHLPLDLHPVYGNNAGLADKLGLINRAPFGMLKGTAVGVRGELLKAKTLGEIRDIMYPGENNLTMFPFGPGKIRTVGIISGGAARDVQQAIDQGLDLYITGEPLHQIYHQCQESAINVLFGGHYLTETTGVSQVMKALADETKLETEFIHIPTGL